MSETDAAQTIDDLIDPQAGIEPSAVEPEPEADGPDEGADALGDAGKQALDRMKAKLKAANERARAAEAKAAAAGDADESDKVRREAEAAALAKANSRIVRAEVKAAAATRLADPADALNFLDLDSFEVDDDGDVDQDEIAEAIADLLARKPYLAAQGGTAKPKPDRSQGATGSGVATNAQRFENSLRGIL